MVLMFCNVVLSVLSSFTIILLVALLNLCGLAVMWLSVFCVSSSQYHGLFLFGKVCHNLRIESCLEFI